MISEANGFLLVIVSILFIGTVLTAMYIVKKINKDELETKKVKSERRRKYSALKLDEFITEIHSFTEDMFVKVNTFDRIKSDYTLAELKARAKSKITTILSSTDLREISAMIDTDLLTDTLSKMRTTNVTLWEKEFSVTLERIFKDYNEWKE